MLLVPAFLTVLAHANSTSIPRGIVQEIYFVRHGETVANATGRYNGSTLNKLSDAGERQARAVAQLLAKVHFDAAVVSPSLRAELTAAPTLRTHHLVATIWPEFNECCTEHGAARKKPASKDLPLGAAINVPRQVADVAKLARAEDRLYAPANYADGLKMVAASATHVRFVLRNPDIHRLLIVGHSAQGSRFLDSMLGRKPIGDIEIKNGWVYVLRSGPDGAFRLVQKIANPVSSGRVDPRMK